MPLGCGDDDSSGSATTTEASSSSASTTTDATSSTEAGSGAQAGTGGSPAGTGGAGAGGTGAGGAGGGPTDDAFGSGTRLRAEVLDGGGAARRFERFFDTELDLFCDVRKTDDGYRCLPAEGKVVFLDDACTEPVIVASGIRQSGGTPEQGVTCGDVPSLGTRALPPAGCESFEETTHEAYRATGAPITVDALFQDYGEYCGGYRGLPTAVRPAELAPQADFAPLDGIREQLDDELALEIASSPDGAFLVLGAWDVARDESCAPPFYPPLDGAHVCSPAHEDGRDQNGNYAYWAEGTCTVPAIFLPNGCASRHTGPILNVTKLACAERRSTLHERGAALPNLWETFGSNPDAECFEQSAGLPGVALGDEIPTSSMPALEELPRPGDATLLVHDGRGGRSIGRSEWRTAEDVACTPRLATDGNTYCLSQTSTNTSPRFADAACTEELIRVSPEVDCELPLYVTSFEPVEACDPSRWPLATIRPLGAIHEGVYYLLDDVGACALDTNPGRFARVSDEELGFDTFPRLERVVE